MYLILSYLPCTTCYDRGAISYPYYTMYLILSYLPCTTYYDRGAISHPYSMREAVATARHLEAYADDPVADALANAVAFEVRPHKVSST